MKSAAFRENVALERWEHIMKEAEQLHKNCYQMSKSYIREMNKLRGFEA